MPEMDDAWKPCRAESVTGLVPEHRTLHDEVAAAVATDDEDRRAARAGMVVLGLRPDRTDCHLIPVVVDRRAAFAAR